MADQPITGLPTKTASGVTSTDKMLGIDSAEGYQILVRDVAKYIIENCDVSTLAGAVRTPKAAIDLLNNNLNNYANRNYLTMETVDCNAVITPGIKRISSTSTNSPDANTLILITTIPIGGQIRQEAYRQNSPDTAYVRGGYITNNQWYFDSWVKYPTRAEITTLNSKKNLPTFTIGAETLANIQSALVTYNNTLSDNDVSFVTFTPSAATGDFKVTTYQGRLTRIYQNRFLVQVQNQENTTMVGTYQSGTWAWEKTPTRSEVNALNSNLKMYQFRKTTTRGADTVTFTTKSEADRYTGLLFVTQNNGASSIYAVGSKKGSTPLCTLLAGTDIGVTIASATGNISLQMVNWSQAILLVDTDNFE